MPFAKVELVVDPTVRNLCYRPYPNHSHGCPNYGKKKGCPPNCAKVTEVLDLSKPTWVIWNVFDFKTHLEKMERLHPDWSDRQKACCLYWQGGARKALKMEIVLFVAQNYPVKVVTCPEAMGVNVTATMRSVGQELEWPPKTKAYQVAIAGTRHRFFLRNYWL